MNINSKIPPFEMRNTYACRHPVVQNVKVLVILSIVYPSDAADTQGRVMDGL